MTTHTIEEMFEHLLPLTLGERQGLLWRWVATGKCSFTNFQQLLPLCADSGFNLCLRHTAGQEKVWKTDVPASVVLDQLQKNFKALKALTLDPKSMESLKELLDVV